MTWDTVLLSCGPAVSARHLGPDFSWTGQVNLGRYHGGRRPSSNDSFHSPAVIPPTALDKLSIMKHYHRTANVQSHLTSPFTDDGNAS